MHFKVERLLKSLTNSGNLSVNLKFTTNLYLEFYLENPQTNNRLIYFFLGNKDSNKFWKDLMLQT